MSIIQSIIGTNLTISAGGGSGTYNAYGYTNPINEGEWNTVNLEYINAPVDTQIFWEIDNFASASNADWLGGSAPSGSFLVSGTGVTNFSFQPSSDATTEGTEGYVLKVGTTPGGTDILNIYLTINDTSISAPPNGTLATSLYFDNVNDRLGYAASDDWVLGTSDFTIEWFQYHTQLPGSNYPRPFSLHHWSSSPISVELSGTGGLYWYNGSSYAYSNPGNATLRNQWNHYAISRDYTSGLIAMWINGQRVMTNTDSLNYGGTGQVLTIGNEDINQNGSYYGYISNFHWVKGTAVYNPSNSTITPPTAPITPVANTKLLLNVTDEAGYITDSSGLSKTPNVTTGFTWSSVGPF